MKFTFHRHVDASPEEVFDLAIDVRAWPRSIDGIIRVEVLTEGPIRVGTRFRETRIMFKREATEEMEFVSIDRPRSYVVVADSHGTHYRSEFRMSPATTGSGTDLALEFQAEPRTVGARVMSFVFRPLAKSVCRLMEKDLDDLKRAVESGRRREPA